MSKVRHVTVSEADDGQRLDRWLKKQLEGTPFGLIQKLVRKGQVRVDGKRAKGDMRLAYGQDVRIPPVESKEQKEKRKLTAEDKAYIQSLVLFDDGDIVAINKPYGLPTQGGSGIYRHVDFYADGLKNDKGIAPRLVHRLDKDTSGVLLLARSAKAVRELGRMFKGRSLRKYYWAICVPAPEMPDGEIHAAIGQSPKKEMMMVDPEEGRPASTYFEVIEHAGKKAAFVMFWPRTGRKHQIRVHAHKMGNPILGDTKYEIENDHPEQDIHIMQELGLADRLHLHAQRIMFKHPLTNEMMDIQASLPDELKKSWKALGFNTGYKEDPFTDIALS
ncbi:MAG: RluA family pseudouridine synthase [Pseudomonadota bacterium]